MPMKTSLSGAGLGFVLTQTIERHVRIDHDHVTQIRPPSVLPGQVFSHQIIVTSHDVGEKARVGTIGMNLLKIKSSTEERAGIVFPAEPTLPVRAFGDHMRAHGDEAIVPLFYRIADLLIDDLGWQPVRCTTGYNERLKMAHIGHLRRGAVIGWFDCTDGSYYGYLERTHLFDS